MNLGKTDTVTTEEKNYIQDSVRNHERVVFKCSTLTENRRDKYLKILDLFLKECDQQVLYNYLSYCLLELLDNANRANAKRIYFKINNLDINNEDDYKRGMAEFKKIISDRNNSYFKKLQSTELTVNLFLSIEEDSLSIQVTNNTKITEVELNRINEKINRAKTYESFEDVLNYVDQTEGSGLGIISIILMLKKIDPATQSLDFTIDEKETIATIKVPINTFSTLEDLDEFGDADSVEEIEEIEEVEDLDEPEELEEL